MKATCGYRMQSLGGIVVILAAVGTNRTPSHREHRRRKKENSGE